MSSTPAHRTFFALLLVFLCACSGTTFPGGGNNGLSTALPLSAQTNPTIKPASNPTGLPDGTPTPSLQHTPEIPTPLPPTPWFVKQGPAKVLCPILLYHRIGTLKDNDPYIVSPQNFLAQMQALKSWGYNSISASELVNAINYGAELPGRPVVITFDDGDETVYSEAFPIMEELGFKGVNYIVVNYIGGAGYMNVEQLKELAAAGWETGSHSMTHTDLTISDKVEWEMVYSRYMLGKLLKVPVNTFAYPYGKANPDMYSVLKKNYQAGMGLGVSTTQRGVDLYYLWRRPILPGWDVETFGSYLPWHSPVEQ
jgi:peptidoglycan/xylan/chitin deacetylase (PgdA/CDA1 family)